MVPFVSSSKSGLLPLCLVVGFPEVPGWTYSGDQAVGLEWIQQSFSAFLRSFVGRSVQSFQGQNRRGEEANRF